MIASPFQNIARAAATAPTESDLSMKHRTVKIDACEIFYREAGPVDAPVVLLPHGYLRDLPEAELHLLDGGHWALETNLDIELRPWSVTF